MICYTIRVFDLHPDVQKIILVTRKEDFPKIKSDLEKYKFKKISRVVFGEKVRQESAYLGLKTAKKIGARKDDIVLFQNASNPLVSPKEIAGVIRGDRKIRSRPDCPTAKRYFKKRK